MINLTIIMIKYYVCGLCVLDTIQWIIIMQLLNKKSKYNLTT